MLPVDRWHDEIVRFGWTSYQALPSAHFPLLEHPRKGGVNRNDSWALGFDRFFAPLLAIEGEGDEQPIQRLCQRIVGAPAKRYGLTDPQTCEEQERVEDSALFWNRVVRYEPLHFIA